jgi:carbamoyltransferase
MEFGPRALGSRSIIGDARSEAMQSQMNLRIKYRESFRPFAPAVLRERCSEWFELDRESPYMLLVAPLHPSKRLAPAPGDEKLEGIDRLKSRRSLVPAITHLDFSARVQTVSTDTNPLFHRLLTAFEKRTGCPVLVNTSFNVRGEPMVQSPADALRCFRRTQLDHLVLGRRIVARKDLPALRPDEVQGALALD